MSEEGESVHFEVDMIWREENLVLEREILRRKSSCES